MELAKQIELAPKNGDFVVLQDGWSGSWEVGRWAPESNSWVQIDGKPLRIFPTHWVPVSGDTVGAKNTEGLSFLVSAIQEPSRRLRIRFKLAFTVAAFLVGGYAVFDFGFTGTGPAKGPSFDKTVLSAAELKRIACSTAMMARSFTSGSTTFRFMTAICRSTGIAPFAC